MHAWVSQPKRSSKYFLSFSFPRFSNVEEAIVVVVGDCTMYVVVGRRAGGLEGLLG